MTENPNTLMHGYLDLMINNNRLLLIFGCSGNKDASRFENINIADISNRNAHKI